MNKLRTKRKKRVKNEASNYIKHFKKLLLTLHKIKVVLYCRVSRCWQKQNGNLDDQRKYLQRRLRRYQKKYGVKIDIVAVFSEVASGWDGDRKQLIAAANTAKRSGAVLLSESTCRFIRNKNYHSSRNPGVLPTVYEYKALVKATKGVILATIISPDISWRKVRARHTKRGQRFKNKFGGRPKKKYPGFLKDRRETMLPVVSKLFEKGRSLGEISKVTGVPKSTVEGWVEKYLK